MTPLPVPIVVLVVDDDVLILQSLEDALKGGGYAVVAARGFNEAIAMLEHGRSDYRAVITDIQMGEGEPTGWELARRARDVDPDMPIVYVTGDSEQDWAANGVPQSILISKPFAPAQLVTAVSQLITAAGSPAR